MDCKGPVANVLSSDPEEACLVLAPDIWQHILEFCSENELLSMRATSTLNQRLVHPYLLQLTNQPREESWEVTPPDNRKDAVEYCTFHWKLTVHPPLATNATTIMDQLLVQEAYTRSWEAFRQQCVSSDRRLSSPPVRQVQTALQARGFFEWEDQIMSRPPVVDQVWYYILEQKSISSVIRDDHEEETVATNDSSPSSSSSFASSHTQHSPLPRLHNVGKDLAEMIFQQCAELPFTLSSADHTRIFLQAQKWKRWMRYRCLERRGHGSRARSSSNGGAKESTAEENRQVLVQDNYVEGSWSYIKNEGRFEEMEELRGSFLAYQLLTGELVEWVVSTKCRYDPLA